MENKIFDQHSKNILHESLNNILLQFGTYIFLHVMLYNVTVSTLGHFYMLEINHCFENIRNDAASKKYILCYNFRNFAESKKYYFSKCTMFN